MKMLLKILIMLILFRMSVVFQLAQMLLHGNLPLRRAIFLVKMSFCFHMEKELLAKTTVFILMPMVIYATHLVAHRLQW
jgi:hypothetical protein